MRALFVLFLFAVSFVSAESRLGFDIEKPLLEDYYSLDPDVAEVIEDKLRNMRDRYGIDVRVWIYGRPPVPRTRAEKMEYNRNLRRPFWLKVHEKFQEYDVGKGYKGGMLAAVNVGRRELKIEATLDIEEIFTPVFVDYTEAIMFRPYFDKDNIQGGVVALVDFIDFRIRQYLDGEEFTPEEYKKDIERKKEFTAWWEKNNTPDAVMRKFMNLLEGDSVQDTLLLMTEASKKMLMKSPLTKDEILDIEYDARVCANPRTITSFSGNYAAIRYSLDQKGCRPWFFRSEDGYWKIDYAAMRKHVGKDAATGEVQLRGWRDFPYRFAFYDVSVDRRGSMVPKTFKIGIVPTEEKGITDDGHDVIVFKVVEGTPAWSAGVLPGDIVVAFNGNVIRTVKEYEAALRSVRRGKPFRIRLRRYEGADRFREFGIRGVAR